MADLLELNDQAREVLSSYGPYVEIDWKEFYVFSDIHGYLKAVERVKSLVESGGRVLILGDYTTRLKPCVTKDENSIEVLKTLYELLIKYPDRLILLRGNHEDQSVHYLPVSLLLKELHDVYGNPVEIEDALMETMREMPLVAISDRAMFMHGGLPVKELPPDFLDKLSKPYDVCKPPYYELVWNAPSSSGETLMYKGIRFNCLGDHLVSHLFGNDVVDEVKEIYKIEHIIVGHIHPQSGFRTFRKLHGVYAVCSSYASCSVRKPRYIRVSDKLEAFDV